jgi:hypothetical protein
MPSVFQKLNLKDHDEIVVVGAPVSFEPELEALAGITIVRDPREAREITFVLAFVTRREQIGTLTAEIVPRTRGDAIVWFAYPKRTSRKYTRDLSRDAGWEPLGAAGFEGVRQVAIDEDWTALRFRKVEFIRLLRRDPRRALTERGKGQA